MAYTVPTCEPTEIIAGETAQWTRSFGDYPASEGGTLKYVFAGPAELEVTATADGDDWAVTITAAKTSALTPGTYRWTAVHTRGAVVRRAATDGTAEGTLVVRAGTLTASQGSAQSHAEQMLARVEAEIKARVDGTGSAHESYTAGGQSMQKLKMSELQSLRAGYAAQVARERGGSFPSHRVRFRGSR